MNKIFTNFFVTFLLLFCAHLAVAQVKKVFVPQYEEIQKLIADENSDNFYPKLLTRFVAMDSTLTSDQIYILYYGQSLQKDYNPSNLGAKEWIEKTKSATKDSYETLKKEFVDSREKFPFDLGALEKMFILATNYEDAGFLKLIRKQFIALLGTISMSGDGKTCESGFHVMSVKDEYTFCRALNLKVTGQKTISNCDYLTLTTNKRYEEGVYFNVSKIFEAYKRIFRN